MFAHRRLMEGAANARDGSVWFFSFAVAAVAVAAALPPLALWASSRSSEGPEAERVQRQRAERHGGGTDV
jgi:hypothetical protein